MKIYELLKARWPEVIMVIGMQACYMALFKDMQHVPQAHTSVEHLFFLTMGIAAFGIISQVLIWGFLRSAAVGEMLPMEPKMLLVVGLRYFWRMLWFQLLLMPVFLLIVLTPQIVVQKMIYGDFKAQLPLWLEAIISTIAGLLLLKPACFIPSLMLRQNCRIRDALWGMRQVRLSRAGRFVFLAAVIIIIGGAAEYLSGLVGRNEMLYYPILALYAVVTSVGALAVYLLAIAEVIRQISGSQEETQR